MMRMNSGQQSVHQSATAFLRIYAPMLKLVLVHFSLQCSSPHCPTVMHAHPP